VAVRIPPRGFGADTLFLTAFAIAWWSFLAMFVGFGAFAAFGGSEKSGSAVESPAEETGPGTQRHPEKTGHDGGRPGASGADQVIPKAIPVFILLFLTPFFLAGFLMVGGILWPLFGRTLVEADGVYCAHRASLFGLGRTHRAALAETRLQWLPEEEVVEEGTRRVRGFAAFVGKSAGLGRLRLSLGTWETDLAAHLSSREKEWIFALLSEALRQGSPGAAR
jgi:hypothetical protein